MPQAPEQTVLLTKEEYAAFGVLFPGHLPCPNLWTDIQRKHHVSVFAADLSGTAGPERHDSGTGVFSPADRLSFLIYWSRPALQVCRLVHHSLRIRYPYKTTDRCC